MSDLRPRLAPASSEAWEAIETQASRTLKACLTARRLVDFRGPFGWQHSAINVGRARALESGPAEGVEGRLRIVQRLVELRVSFALSREELDTVSRGVADPDLQPLVDAARKLALGEDRAIFYGYPSAGIRGISDGSPHRALALNDDFASYPWVVAEAVETLRDDAIEGPYALALSPRLHAGLARTAGAGGYAVLRQVERMLDGPIVRTDAMEGALVVSVRGGDFELTVGRDISIGYLDHDAVRVQFYLEESVTFRVLTPEAAVRMEYRA